MKTAFLKIKSILSFLWHTVVCMFIKNKDRKQSKHIYLEDVDNDGSQEIVLDPNGREESSETMHISKS